MLQFAAMKRALWSLVSILCFFLVAPSCAAQRTARQLKADCLHKPADYSAGFCGGFIEAVLDMNDLHLLTARLNNPPSGSPMCIPAGVGWAQLRKVVLKYMNNHP
jgi:hypothetical protein